MAEQKQVARDRSDRDRQGSSPLPWPLHLNTPLTRTPGPFEIRRSTVLISRQHWQRLQNLAKASGITVFTLCLRAFSYAVAGYAGIPDLLIAVPTSRRQRIAEERSIGCFIRVQVCRMERLLDRDADSQKTRAQLRPMHTRVQTMLGNAQCALSTLAHGQTSTRLPSGNLLTDVLFVFQNFGDLSHGFQAATTSQHADTLICEIPARYSDFPLTCELVPEPRGCRVQIRYATVCFDQDQVLDLFTRFRAHLNEGL